jgi:hypothetical protein
MGRMKIYKILPLFILLCSCSSAWHIKKAISKDPSILEKDTIVFTDSVHVITKEVTHDSIFMVSKDTVTLVKDNLTIKHFYHKDSIYLWGECASDTIVKYKTVKIPTEKVVFKESWFPKWLWVLIIIILIGYLIHKVLFNNVNYTPRI